MSFMKLWEKPQKKGKEYLKEKGLISQPALTSGLIVGSKNFVKELLEKCAKRFTSYAHRKLYEYSNNTYCINRRLKMFPISMRL